MQVFSGSSNPELARKIAKLLGDGLGVVESTKFDNGEAKIAIKEDKLGREAVLVQSLSMPVDEHIVEFCLLADALTRKGVSNLVGVVPWLGYSKQDKVFLPGESLAAKVIAQIIQTTKIRKLITFDLHNRAITGFFDIPVVELSAKPLLVEYFRNRNRKVPNSGPESSEPGGSELREPGNTVVVAPDAGAAKASSSFARELSAPIVYMDKRRDLTTGRTEVVGMSGEVRGAAVIIVDDMIVTGGTAQAAAKYLKQQGARRVSVAATHHLYVPGVQEKLEKSEIDEVVVTDTVLDVRRQTSDSSGGKLKVLSVAKLIVDELS